MLAASPGTPQPYLPGYTMFGCQSPVHGVGERSLDLTFAPVRGGRLPVSRYWIQQCQE
jgi:hypothetical protein